jgi:glycosyltransferase involved in cell wall biosynthesis
MTGAPGQQAPARPPTVSVIMIFWNAERYLEAAIDSVFRQTLIDWELVLVDDGSSDASRAIAEQAVVRDPSRVRLCEHAGRRNLGTGPSRNLGLGQARGRYLCFLDADDVYEPARLQRAVACLEAHPEVGVVISHELYWRSWQPAARGWARFHRQPDEVVGPSAPLERPIPPPLLFASTLATPGAAMPGICSVTFRSADAERLAMIPECFVSQYEDQALIARLLLERTALVIADCLSRYRQHGESLTHRALLRGEYRPRQPHVARSQYLDWLRGYLRERGIDEPLLTRAIDAELAIAAAADSSRRWPARPLPLRRVALTVANLLLPRAAADALVRAYLRRQRGRADRRAARIAAEMAARRPATPHQAGSSCAGGTR